jgi:hypothetical protein
MSEPALKVFGWVGYHDESTDYHKQARMICAVRSKAELRRITGLSRSFVDDFAGITGNAQEIEAALREPGLILWRSINDRSGEYTLVTL